MEERHGDEDQGASVLMMPPMPLVRPRKEDKTSELARFVRAEYGESCAGWIASGLEPEVGTALPCARSSPWEVQGRNHDPEREPYVDRCCAADPAPSRI
ncbi:MAG: hypothetical protein MUO94_01885 [Thermoplasmata archaeon]|nr:hypothetical protein [Thermoplasmata archaeon]